MLLLYVMIKTNVDISNIRHNYHPILSSIIQHILQKIHNFPIQQNGNVTALGGHKKIVLYPAAWFTTNNNSLRVLADSTTATTSFRSPYSDSSKSFFRRDTYVQEIKLASVIPRPCRPVSLHRLYSCFCTHPFWTNT